mgnify:CR=1 FL=1
MVENVWMPSYTFCRCIYYSKVSKKYIRSVLMSTLGRHGGLGFLQTAGTHSRLSISSVADAGRFAEAAECTLMPHSSPTLTSSHCFAPILMRCSSMDLTLAATVVLCLVHGAFTPPAFHALGSTTMGSVPAIFDDLGW